MSNTLTWQPEFDLQHPRMDDTHREFVALLAAVEHAAPGAEAAQALQQLLAHTEAHFAQEERWMAELGFAADNCHYEQHESVLQVAREVARRHALAPDARLLAQLVAALAQWFTMHATTADAALAMALAAHDFVGAQRAHGTHGEAPHPAPAALGCGAKSCG